MIKFYICKHCNNIIAKVNDSGVPVVCCGEEMKELIPNTFDASKEKHIPVVKVNNNNIEVEIGSVIHPMVEEHFIEWIYIKTKKGGQRKILKPGDDPKALFVLTDDEFEAAYAYCNLHGLWKSE